jgi:hypothetical protein
MRKFWTWQEIVKNLFEKIWHNFYFEDEEKDGSKYKLKNKIANMEKNTITKNLVYLKMKKYKIEIVMKKY